MLLAAVAVLLISPIGVFWWIYWMIPAGSEAAMDLPETLEGVLQAKVRVRQRIVERMEEAGYGAVTPDEIDLAYLSLLEAQEAWLREQMVSPGDPGAD